MSFAKEAGNSVNSFSMKLYSKLTKDKPKENLFFSPTSICVALAMTYAGAKGNTAKELEQTMNWNTPNAVHEMMKNLQESLMPSSGVSGMELKLANRLWAQSGLPILKEFTKVLQDCYDAVLGEVNFQDKTEEARLAINQWIEKKTNAKIKDLLREGVLTSNTRLVLTNAVYFKGFWQDQFPESSTHDWDFKITKTETSKIKLMNTTAEFMYTEMERLSCQVLALPYKEQKVIMMIFLPSEDFGLEELEGMVNADLMETCSEMLIHQEVHVSLPKFKVDCQINLNEILKQLGICSLLAQNSDLSGITGNKDLFVSDVIHQAFIDVNEEGTEAAAATAMVMNKFICALPEEEPPHFLADHPFLFAIKHCESGAVLFMGRIISPNSS